METAVYALLAITAIWSALSMTLDVLKFKRGRALDRFADEQLHFYRRLKEHAQHGDVCRPSGMFRITPAESELLISYIERGRRPDGPGWED